MVKISSPIQEAKAAKIKSVACMAAANAFHFTGYEVSRSGLLALFTSHRTGFRSASTVSLATGCVSPFSVALLWAHTRLFDCSGPRLALRYATLFVVVQLAAISLVLEAVDSRLGESNRYLWISRGALFFLFVSQSSFVQLLCSQHWSFISSIPSEEEGALWFAPIAGIGSLVSSFVTLKLLPHVDRIGLTGLVQIGSLFLLGCAFFSDMAYSIAERHNFAPADERKARDIILVSQSHQLPLFRRAWDLFQRRPILGALTAEVLICQFQSSLLAYLFVASTKSAIVNDDRRAQFTGGFYSWVNLGSGALQFTAVPLAMKLLDRKQLWMVIPMVMLLSSFLMLRDGEASFLIVVASYGTYKALEYSLRGALTEMVYVSLDFESRFLGKEILNLVANRLGKSGMAVVLALLTNYMGPSFVTWAPKLLVVLSFLWVFISYRLERHLSLMGRSKKAT